MGFAPRHLLPFTAILSADEEMDREDKAWALVRLAGTGEEVGGQQGGLGLIGRC